jgi:nanoRNase/pAp phosphatase (c-di-AMP/oligoRNAs hydrolase)
MCCRRPYQRRPRRRHRHRAEEPLADAFGGDAGGHATAAATDLDTADNDAVEAHALAHLEDALDTQFGEFT